MHGGHNAFPFSLSDFVAGFGVELQLIHTNHWRRWHASSNCGLYLTASKLTALIALPYCSPSYTKGDYTSKPPRIKFATKSNKV
jgi:hypothetical protein